MDKKTNHTTESVLKIVLTGPESTGKSTLAQKLAIYYQTVWVPEYARAYIGGLNRPYNQEDILRIAQGQLERENIFLINAHRLLICDTALLVPKIWSEVVYGECAEWIEKQFIQRHYDLYLLMYPDIEWKPDPQREHPHRRKELFELYQRTLQKINTPFAIIKGGTESRMILARQAIDKIIKKMAQK